MKGKKKPVKRVLKIKIRRDKLGRYIIIKGRKYRIGKTVTEKNLASFVIKKLNAIAKQLSAKGTTTGPVTIPQKLEQQAVAELYKEQKKLSEFQEKEREKQSAYDRDLLKGKTASELKTIAKDLNIPGRSKFTTKAALAEGIIKHQEGSAFKPIAVRPIAYTPEETKEEKLTLAEMVEKAYDKFDTYTVQQLKALSRKLGVKIKSGTKKADIKDKIEDALERSAQVRNDYRELINSTPAGRTTEDLLNEMFDRRQNLEDAYERVVEKKTSEDMTDQQLEKEITEYMKKYANKEVSSEPDAAQTSEPEDYYSAGSPSPAPTTSEPEDNGETKGEGRQQGMDPNKGMSNIQIDKVMKKYPEYLGCISHNEFKKKILPHVKPQSRGGIVINTDPISKPGSHWQSVFWDARPEGSASIEFFDSFADPLDKQLRRDIKALAEKLDAKTYLKLKENTIQLQDDRTANCGLFAMKFLIDRFRGKPFREASGYDDSVRGEGQIKKFRKQVGFGYVASFGGSTETHGGYDLFYDKELPRSVRKYLKGPDIPISSIHIVREPIQSALNTAINILSLGKWSAAKKELGYANLFHLYMIINGNIKLERNHVVEMGPGRIDSSNKDIQSIPVSLLGKQLTLKELLNNTINKIGIANMNRYDPAENNCQNFMLQVLDANGLGGNPHARDFIKQDAKSVISKLPSFTQYVMKGVTDVAHIGTKVIDDARTALTGQGKKKRGGKKWSTPTVIPTISDQFE